MEKSDFYENFCANVGYLRLYHGMTQAEMAAVLGVSVGKLRKLEKGNAWCRVDCGMIRRLCLHFNVTANSVLLTRLPEP